MTRFLSIALFVVAAAACGGKSKPAPAAPSASGTDSAATAEADVEACHKECVANGPGMPTTPEEWASKSAEEKQQECDTQCPGAEMPVEMEQQGQEEAKRLEQQQR